ncbi:MAG TPA: hypothetical protein VJQ84_06220 [Solirubrobacterales bacterium]|nr:hypothetical protein [Solirubrobacterales bacterium]
MMKLAGVGAAVVFVLAVFAGFSAAYFGGGASRVDSTVKAVNKDQARLTADSVTINGFFAADVAFPSFKNATTPASFVNTAHLYDATSDQLLAKLNGVVGLIGADQATVEDGVSRSLNTGSDFSSLFDRAKLDKLETQLGYERQALDIATSIVNIAQSQVRSAKSAIDAMAAFAVLVERLQAQDWRGAVNEYDTVHMLLSQSQEQASDAHFPDVWATMLSDLNQLADDTRAGAQYVLNGDPAGAHIAADSIDKDAHVIASLDTSAMNNNAYVEDQVGMMKDLERQGGLLIPSSTV